MLFCNLFMERPSYYVQWERCRVTGGMCSKRWPSEVSCWTTMHSCNSDLLRHFISAAQTTHIVKNISALTRRNDTSTTWVIRLCHASLVYSYFAGGRNIDPLEFRGSYSFFSYCVVLCHSLFYFLYCIFLCLLPKWQINLFIVPHRIIWNWYTDRWWVGCYIWYSEEETGWGRSPPLLAVPNVTAHPSMASVPITIF